MFTNIDKMESAPTEYDGSDSMPMDRYPVDMMPMDTAAQDAKTFAGGALESLPAGTASADSMDAPARSMYPVRDAPINTGVVMPEPKSYIMGLASSITESAKKATGWYWLDGLLWPIAGAVVLVVTVLFFTIGRNKSYKHL